MCVYAFYLNKTEDTFILVGNRDEEFKRRALGLHFFNRNTIMGIDFKEKGSWFGLNIAGRIAFLTNYRDPSIFKENAPSRGLIVKRFLTENMPHKGFIGFLQNTKDIFNGYNLIFGNLASKQLFYYSNIKDELVSIDEGIHCVSNAFLDSEWPKCKRLKNYLGKIVRENIENVDMIFYYLEDRTEAPEERLPNTNIDRSLEKRLSSIFVNVGNIYGTQFSYFLKNEKDNIIIFEKDYTRGTKNRFAFTLKEHNDNGVLPF